MTDGLSAAAVDESRGEASNYVRYLLRIFCLFPDRREELGPVILEKAIELDQDKRKGFFGGLTKMVSYMTEILDGIEANDLKTWVEVLMTWPQDYYRIWNSNPTVDEGSELTSLDAYKLFIVNSPIPDDVMIFFSPGSASGASSLMETNYEIYKLFYEWMDRKNWDFVYQYGIFFDPVKRQIIDVIFIKDRSDPFKRGPEREK